MKTTKEKFVEIDGRIKLVNQKNSDRKKVQKVEKKLSKESQK